MENGADNEPTLTGDRRGYRIYILLFVISIGGYKYTVLFKHPHHLAVPLSQDNVEVIINQGKILSK